MNLNAYATLNDLRVRQNLATSDTGDDARLLAKLRAATAQIERYTARRFCPINAARAFDVPAIGHSISNVLLFRGYDALSLTTIVNGDGVTVIPTTDYVLLGGDVGPIYGIELDRAKNYFTYLTTKKRALSVTAVWGWHDDYANAWKPSTDVIPGGGITSSATSFVVTSAAGLDGWGLTPCFTPGQLIKVDSEYMHIVAVNTGTNTLTVVRGANGSTAATHAAAATIAIYVPTPDIVEICLRWAAWLYKTEDAGDFAGVGSESAAGGLTVPAAIPSDLRGVLEGLRKRRVG